VFPGANFDREDGLGLSNKEIAKIVGMQEFFDSVYWQQSSLVHTDLTGHSSRLTENVKGFDIETNKTPKEVDPALFYTLDINLSLAKSFYKKTTILNKYIEKRDSLEKTLNKTL
jgi:hypothetical protein